MNEDALYAQPVPLMLNNLFFSVNIKARRNTRIQQFRVSASALPQSPGWIFYYSKYWGRLSVTKETCLCCTKSFHHSVLFSLEALGQKQRNESMEKHLGIQGPWNWAFGHTGIALEESQRYRQNLQSWFHTQLPREQKFSHSPVLPLLLGDSSSKLALVSLTGKYDSFDKSFQSF